jgi:hypothetical protein
MPARCRWPASIWSIKWGREAFSASRFPWRCSGEAFAQAVARVTPSGTDPDVRADVTLPFPEYPHLSTLGLQSPLASPRRSVHDKRRHGEVARGRKLTVVPLQRCSVA